MKKSVFYKLESILAGAYDFMPTDKYRRASAQGWNDEAKAYLRSIGYSDEIIDEFYAIIKDHINNQDVNEKMKTFILQQPKIVSDIARFEITAYKERVKEEIAKLEDEIKRKREEIAEGCPDWYSRDPEVKKEYIRDLKTDLKYLLSDLEMKKTEDPIVYRKGDIDKIVLSWTPDRDGAKFWGKSSDGGYEYYLSPDRSAKVKDLIRQRIYPVTGYGSFVNFYENEITFINMNLVKESV